MPHSDRRRKNPTQTPPPESGPRIPAGIWVLGFVSLLMDISSELVHSLLPVFLVTALGASAFTVGILEGTAEATALIVKVFSGTLSDYLGKRKILAVIGYGLGALSKPLFAIASSIGMVFTARLTDRIGKGIRGAPRDALVADIVPPEIRGAAYGLRQSLDTAGAVVGPLLAVGLMLLWSDDIRAVFRVALIPAALAVVLLMVGVREPQRSGSTARRSNPLRWRQLRRLSPAFWWVVMIGVTFALARFSEAFLILRARDSGLPLSWLPLTLVAMNAVYAATAYPFGRLSDRLGYTGVLVLGITVLIGADLVLAADDSAAVLFVGIALWGLHMGITQGLLATMVAATAPADLRGTAFGFFNLFSGLALLLASVLAGLLWEVYGPAVTFLGGALFCVMALAVILLSPLRE